MFALHAWLVMVAVAVAVAAAVVVLVVTGGGGALGVLSLRLVTLKRTHRVLRVSDD
jgi:hypothetical protein